MYAKIENNLLAEWPIANLRQRLPQTSFPEVISNDNLPDGFVFIAPAIVPEYDSATHKITLGAPAKVSGIWKQRYVTAALSADELEANRAALVPQQVTMRQARAALIAGGFMSAINEALAAMTGVEGELARSNWEYAATVDRNDSLTLTLGAILGLSSLQIDNLFIAAAAL